MRKKRSEAIVELPVAAAKVLWQYVVPENVCAVRVVAVDFSPSLIATAYADRPAAIVAAILRLSDIERFRGGPSCLAKWNADCKALDLVARLLPKGSTKTVHIGPRYPPISTIGLVALAAKSDGPFLPS